MEGRVGACVWVCMCARAKHVQECARAIRGERVHVALAKREELGRGG